MLDDVWGNCLVINQTTWALLPVTDTSVIEERSRSSPFLLSRNKLSNIDRMKKSGTSYKEHGPTPPVIGNYTIDDGTWDEHGNNLNWVTLAIFIF